jgi:Protein of unknown function (DUF1353)
VPEPSRFFDVGAGGQMELDLRRDGARFQILRPFGYRDPRYREPFVVPADVARFRTDLASIPWVFAWLVPGLGSHLPAVLLHDGLVVGKTEGKTHLGPDVTREEADGILRDAMANLGVPLIRRWLMWTAVILATALSTLRPRWYWIGVVALTLLGVATLGVLATLDVADVWDVLPWLGDRPWYVELLAGAIFAVLVPLVLSLLWRRLWKAGAIAGVALAFLLHVTVAVIIVGGIYWIAEKVVSAPEGHSPNVRENLDKVEPAA